MTIQVDLISDEGMRRRLAAVPGAVQKAGAQTAVQIEDLLEQGAGRHAKSGAIERSIFKRSINGGWEIGHDMQVAPHARFVHDGTRPHVIEPNKRKALRWPVPGKFAFAKRVNHPGYAGDAWLDRAAAKAPVIFNQLVQQHLRGI